MKKLLLLLLLFFSVGASAQWVSIPDSNFGTWLNTNGYSACMQGSNSLGWQMDTTCNAVMDSTNVGCSAMNIHDLTGIQYFDNLQFLGCSSNRLSSIPPLPNSLRVLKCINNQLTSLPLSLSSTNIYWLECQNNQLTSLPQLPDSLEWFMCHSNQLINLPGLPAKLYNLNCSRNQLTTLPALPDSLRYLTCQNNQLASIPPLPGKVTDIYCDTNQLTSLPPLPNKLKNLYAGYNQLSSLPVLSNSLIFLDCWHNQLLGLPPFPASLKTALFENNQISDVPELPDTMSILALDSNPISCLPQLKYISQLWFRYTNVTCLPNYGSVPYSMPALNSIPICDSLNINGCPYCNAFFSIYPDSANAGVYYGYNQSYGSNLTSYLWKFGDGDTSNLQYPSHTYSQPGQYYVCLTVSGPDCTNTYCDSSYLVFKTEGGLMSQLNILNPATAIPQILNPQPEFRIFPNPARDAVTISVDEGMIGSSATVSDITGRRVAAVNLTTQYSILTTAPFSSGVYFVTVTDKEGRSATKKLIISK